MLTRIRRIEFAPDGTLWLGAREGVYFSKDDGKSWLWIGRLPFRDVDDLEYDAQSHRVLVSSRTNDQVFSIDPKTMTWKWWHTGYPIALIRPAGDRLVRPRWMMEWLWRQGAGVSSQGSVDSGQWTVDSGQWTVDSGQ